MAEKTPVRVVFNESNVATGLAEFQSGDAVGVAFGGTGLNAIGSAGQVLKVKPSQGGLRARIKDQDFKHFGENLERIAIEVCQLKDKLDAVENRQIERLGQFESVINDLKRVIICWDDLQDD